MRRVDRADRGARARGVDASSIVLLVGVKRAPEDRVGVASCPRDQVIDLLGELSVGGSSSPQERADSFSLDAAIRARRD